MSHQKNVGNKKVNNKVRPSSEHKKRFSIVAFALAATVLGAVIYLGGVAPSVSIEAQTPSDPIKPIGIDKGVFNDGQAALWDLNIIDSYRLFGAKERAKGYAPEQPIKFSHALHAGQNKIECQFCHWTVNKSAFAAIPEVEVCMGCHGAIVSTERTTKSPEVAKLKEYAAKNEPIPWKKVHVMPDHVRFNHKRHVKAGVNCHECHGQVQEMEVVERVSSMKMGWCVDCHRQRGTSIDCTTCHK